MFAIEALLVLSLVSGTVDGSAATGLRHENLMSTLWVQHAAEYSATTRTAYGMATALLDAALEDTDFTAATEQLDADYEDLPPAIVLDVDETVLDNVLFQSRLILDGETYGSDNWKAWCEERIATPVPGALDFLRTADAKGFAIFYVTNRKANVETATADNLRALGFPIVDGHVLTRGARPEWTRDKTTRRAHVASTHRIVMMFGDNLGDFVAVDGLGVPARDARVAQANDWWGTRWFMLPNPMYGSWEDALLDGDRSGTRSEQLERLREWLED